MRDTGDPKTAEGGQIEWGYYEENEPRLVHPRDLLEKEQARLSPSQRDLEMEQVIEPLGAGDGADADPRRARLQRGPFVQRPPADHHRRRPVDGREPEGARPLVRGRHLGQGRPRHGQAHRRLDDRRAHGDRPRAHRLRPLQPVRARGEVHRGALHRDGAARSTTRRCIRASPSPAAAASGARRSGSARRSSAATSWSSAAGSARTATPRTSTCSRSTATGCRCARTSGTAATSGGCRTPSSWR